MKLLQIIKYDELIDSLSINRKRPSIKATDILIETKAAGLSPSDYKMVYTIFYKLFFEIQKALKCSVFQKIFTTAILAGSKFSMAALKRFCSDRTLFHKYKNPEYK
jgi:uncharacterized surface anchored protein